MKRLISLDNAKKLTEELINDNLGTLRNPEGYLKHLVTTYEIAGKPQIRYKRQYPLVSIDVEEVAIAWYLHDVGRPLNENQLLHELTGARWIEENGLERGICDNITDVYRIAQMIRPHNGVYELFSYEGSRKIREDLESKEVIDVSLLLPRTIQEKIITYSDSANTSGIREYPEERMNQAIKKYREKGGKEKSWVNHVIENGGVERRLEVCRKVKEMCEGKLSEKEITRYGVN